MFPKPARTVPSMRRCAVSQSPKQLGCAAARVTWSESAGVGHSPRNAVRANVHTTRNHNTRTRPPLHASLYHLSVLVTARWRAAAVPQLRARLTYRYHRRHHGVLLRGCSTSKVGSRSVGTACLGGHSGGGNGRAAAMGGAAFWAAPWRSWRAPTGRCGCHRIAEGVVAPAFIAAAATTTAAIATGKRCCGSQCCTRSSSSRCIGGRSRGCQYRYRRHRQQCNCRWCGQRGCTCVGDKAATMRGRWKRQRGCRIGPGYVRSCCNKAGTVPAWTPALLMQGVRWRRHLQASPRSQQLQRVWWERHL